jgi:hypothetical protein
MLYGKTPKRDKFNELEFPANVSVSSNAKEFLRKSLSLETYRRPSLNILSSIKLEGSFKQLKYEKSVEPLY